MRRINILLSITALVAVSLSSVAARAATMYTVTNLGTLSGSTASYGTALNSSGIVVGYTNSNHAFYYDGSLHDLTSGKAWGINDTGAIVGEFPGSGGTHAFSYDGTLHDLGTLGGTTSIAYGVSAGGTVVGQSQLTGNLVSHAFNYNGTMNDLGTLGGTVSAATSISPDGSLITGASDITGNAENHAFRYDGTMHDLGTLGGTFSTGQAINDSGEIAGFSFTSSFELHAFLDDGTMHDLGTLGGSISQGFGINAAGASVGFSYTAGDAAIHAFLYDGTMLDLNDLIDPLSGWELVQALAINASGQITGFGKIGGEDRAFLLTPVPEPSGLVLAACGAAALALLARRRMPLSRA